MKTLFDHQAFTMQMYGGVSRYFAELMKQFSNKHDSDFELSLKFSNNIYVQDYNKNSNLKNLPPRFTGKSTLLNLFNKPSSIKKIKNQNYDIFHPTYYDPYFLKYIMEKPFVLTVHDMTHELFPEKINRWDKSAIYKKILVEKAARIICVSENTKNDLCRILNVNEKKVTVIHLASNFQKTPLSERDNTLPVNYILYVGSRGYYKNFKTLVKAIHPVLKENDYIYFICAGGGRFSNEELSCFDKLDIFERVLYKEANDSYLQMLYTNALVFILPSLYEGFGIPILEAFNCECPVITSNVSSLPEIAGDAAYYIDPSDSKMITGAVDRLINDAELREKLINRGKIMSEKYSWEKTAEKTIKVYKDISSSF